ncbi:hypothetical protein FQN54_005502 [Arachnomyces sp. PD_36]|nr:hypothetical protein FQN54_005502 [Arachnomyces sp. PD_36]
MAADMEALGSRQALINGVTAAMLSATIVVVALRVIARNLSKARFWWDDYLIFFGAVVTVALNIITFVGVSYGLGRHTADVVRETSPENVIKYSKILYSTMTAYQWAMTAIKCSILMLYYRLFHVNTPLRYSVYALLTFVILWHFSFFFALVFQCTPVAFFWDRTIPGGHCVDHGAINNNALSVSNAATNVFTDFMILFLPLPMIWKLQLSWIRKAGLLLIFMLGAFDCAVGVIRMTLLIDGQTADLLWSNSLPQLWTIIELDIAIICACLPVLVPLFTKLFRSAVAKSNYISNYKSGSHQSTSGFRSSRGGFGRMGKSNSNTDMQNLNSSYSSHTGASHPSFKERPPSDDLELQGSRVDDTDGITITQAWHQSVQSVTDDETRHGSKQRDQWSIPN